MGEAPNEQMISLPPALQMELAAAQAAWLARNNTRRLWSKDATLWTGRDEASWLGWLDVIDSELRALEPLQDFAQDLRAQKFTDVLLLGMGGSSLGPEVLAKSLGSAPSYPALHVLDSTDPEQVRRFEASVDIARTLFIVASKSGTTLEPNVLMDYFFARASAPSGAQPPRISSPSQIPARFCKRPPRKKAFAASSSAFPASAAAIPFCRNSAWSRWRRPGRTRALFCATRARWRRRAVPPATLPIIPVWR